MNYGAVMIYEKGTTVKNQFGLSPYLIDINNRHLVFSGVIQQNIFSQFCLII